MEYYNTRRLIYNLAEVDDQQFLDMLEVLPTSRPWMVPGGADVDPELYGEVPTHTGWFDTEVDIRELLLVSRLIEIGAPILGICRGHQLITVAEGGTLYQDLSLQGAYSHDHGPVQVIGDSLLAEIFPVGHQYRINDTLVANSLHHQSTKDIPEGWYASAWTQDGVIEAIENPDKPNIISVQWHPEINGQFHDMLKYLYQFTKE